MGWECRGQVSNVLFPIITQKLDFPSCKTIITGIYKPMATEKQAVSFTREL